MLNEIYGLEARRIAELKLNADADLEHPVFGEGNSNEPVIMLIGEAPGREEAAAGRPFVGKAGRQLDRMLQLAGIERQSVFVTNAVKYRPITLKERSVSGREPSVSNRTPSVKEVKAGLDTLKKEILLIKPKVIATLGNIPLSAVMLMGGGEKLTVGDVHGMPRIALIDGVPFTLFPLYHPAAAIYYRELKPVLERDLVSLGAFASRL